MRKVAADVTGVVLPDSGHFPAEEVPEPEPLTKALLDFLR